MAEPSGKNLPSGLVTFMFTDIVGSTEMKPKLTGRTSSDRDESFRRDVKIPHDAIVSECVAAHDGFIFKDNADGFATAFSDAQKAVLCGLEIQERLTAMPIQVPNGTLQVRVGLHTDHAVPSPSPHTCSQLDYIGSAPDKAARVQGCGKPGQVFISHETYGMTATKIRGVGFDVAGEFDMKGVGKEPLYLAFREGQNPLALIEDKYRQHLIERFRKLTLYSRSSDKPLAVDLEQVFVKLTTVVPTELRGIITRGTIRGKIPLAHLESMVDYARERMPSLGDITLTANKDGDWEFNPPVVNNLLKDRARQPLSTAEALRAHDHLAIIGAPGAGKTTLLQWIALAFARRQGQQRLELDEDRLPLFVALRDFNRFLDCHDKDKGLPSPLPPALLAKHLQEYYAEFVPHLKLPDNFFQRALANGKAIVLLDGLDEVASATKRARAAEFVAACVRAYPGCRFVLTSRPRGYENDCRAQLAAHCAECRVRDFDDDDIALFAKNWYLAVTLDREGDNPTARDKAEAAAKNLLEAVKQERVRPLAASPLLLSILALIHQKGVGLPQRRVELYQECVEFLLGYWDQVREGDVGKELANLGGWDRNIRRKMLEPIALWMHGRGENRTEAHRDELIPKLAEQFRKCFGGEIEQATLQAEDFLKVIELRTGVLIPKEQDAFEFAHPTFREYFAACALMNRPDYVEAVLDHLHDPWWIEVHLLAIGHIGSGQDIFVQERVGRLLGAIRQAGSPYEKELCRDLLFAFRALCDVGALGVDDAARRELVDAVFQLWRKTKVKPLRYRIEDLFGYAGATLVGGMLTEKLLALTRNRSVNEQYSAVQALGNLGSKAATPEILARLMALTQDSSQHLQISAVQALGNLGSAAATPVVLTRLVELIQGGSEGVRFRAVYALEELGSVAVNPEILARLMALTQDGREDVRASAAFVLGSLGNAVSTPAVLARLVELCQDDSKDVRCHVADALGRLGSAAATPAVLAQLVELLQDPSEDVWARTMSVLGRLGSAAATPEILARLMALTQDGREDVRASATQAFGRLGSAAAIPAVLARLVELIHDAREDVRASAVYALGELGSAAATPEVLDRLIALTQDSSEHMQFSAINALGRLGSAAATRAVLTRLVNLIQDSNERMRFRATNALVGLGSAAATPEILSGLVALIQDSSEDVRDIAVSALGNLGSAAATPEILAQLVVLTQDSRDHVRFSVTNALVETCRATATPEVIAVLLNLMADKTLRVQRSACYVLGQMSDKLDRKSKAQLVAFWQRYLDTDNVELMGNTYHHVAHVAFDTLHRLAELEARQGPVSRKPRGSRQPAAKQKRSPRRR